MKRFLSLLTAGALCLSLLPPAHGAEGTTFVDISPENWCAPYVEVCAAEGLMKGVGEDRFDPQGALTVEEALVLAARVLWRVDGGTGALPKGGSVEQFWMYIYGDDPPSPNPEQWTRYQLLSLSWSWDGIYYITRRFREEYGHQSTRWYSLNNTAADREMFFHVLSLPVKAFDLPTINQILDLPDVDRENDPELYQLYEAGIVTGVDRYGFAAPGGSLTRAEAAAMAARVLEPSLRVMGWTPSPLPTEGYTLTYLMDGRLSYPIYPVALVDILNETGESMVSNGFLTVDGQWLDWPKGTEEGVPSFGLGNWGDYLWLRPWDRSGGNYWGAKTGLMDRTGEMVIPFGLYDNVRPTGDGHFIGEKTDSAYWTRSFLLSPEGEVEAELSGYYGTPECTWGGFNEGVCPWRDEDTGLWGYRDAAGNWTMEPCFSSASSFGGGLAIVGDEDGRNAVIDRQGHMVLPWREGYYYLPGNSPDYRGPQGLVWYGYGPEGSFWLDLEGNIYPTGGADGSMDRFHNGYLTVNNVYFDTTLQPVSQKFDCAGDLDPQGRGLVQLDNKIYRIEFQK